MEKITKYSGKCPAPSGFKSAQPATTVKPIVNGIFGFKNPLTNLFNVVKKVGCTVLIKDCETKTEGDLPNFTIPPVPVKIRKRFF